MIDARPVGEGVFGPSYDEADAELLAGPVATTYLDLVAAMAAGRVAPWPRSMPLAVGTLASALIGPMAKRLPDSLLGVYECSEAVAAYVAARHPTLHVGTLASLPLPLASEAYTHAVMLHPLSSPRDRGTLLRELGRLLVPGGQLVVTTPLRRSFAELIDMFREFATKHDAADFASAIEVAVQLRPTPDQFGQELEELGFVDVDVDVELLSVPFESGRAFEAHSLLRLVLAPDFVRQIDAPAAQVYEALAYAADAVAKYWADVPFDLTVNLGCAVAYRPR